tara:strand:+ start:1183 stop:1665 length:483 start_codon:yes stop_codon:yes gene_type:complete
MKNKIVAVFTIFFFLVLVLPAKSYAESTKPVESIEAISPLSKGQKAPFEGILFSKSLAARLEAERKTMITLKMSEAQSAMAVTLATSKLQLKLDILNGRYSALEEKHTKIVQINQEQIDFLRKQYLPTPWYEHPAFLVTIGIISGIGLTIGAAHIVKTVK